MKFWLSLGTRAWIMCGLSLLAAAIPFLVVVFSPTQKLAFQIGIASTQPSVITLVADGSHDGPPVEARIIADGRLHSYRIQVPDLSARHIRIGIGDTSRQLLFRDASLFRTGWASVISRVPIPLLDASGSSLIANADDRDQLRVHVSGAAPVIDISIAGKPWAVLARVLFVSCVLGTGSFLLVSFLFGRIFRIFTDRPAKAGRIRHRDWRKALDHLLASIRDPHPIVFGRASLVILAAVSLTAVVWISAGLHQSSIGKWDEYLPGENAEATTLIGQPRDIRSDEWLVFTPWMLSQIATGSNTENASIGAHRSPLLASIPVIHPVSFFQPEYWGFTLFGVERGFSWLWAFKIFGLFTSVFLLFLLLSRGDTPVSAFGALWICGSSYTQWWFSTSLPQLLTGLCLSIVGLTLILQSRGWAYRAAGCLLMVLGTSTFVFHFYPAWQVTLGYLAIAIVSGQMLDARRSHSSFPMGMRGRLVCLLGVATVVGMVLYVFMHDARTTIQAMMDTAYPGKRISIGGEKTWRALFDGYFEPWRVGETAVPLPPSNPSEASNFALLFPLVLVAAACAYRTAWKNGVLVALTIYCTMLTLWMTVPLPPDLADWLARFTMLSYVPPHRALLALGFASCAMVVTWMAWIRHQAGYIPRLPWFAVPLPMVVVLGFGMHLRGIDPDFFVPWRIFLGMLVVGLASVAIFRGSLLAFAAMVVLLVAPGVTVNPLARGLAPILRKDVVAEWVKESSATPSRPVWIVIGGFALPQALKANGLQVFGGATWIPDRVRLTVLDPRGAYADIWNRYAHIQLESAPGLAEPEFQMVDSPGVYKIRLDICSGLLARLGVGHVVYVAAPPREDLKCLAPVSTSAGELRTYRVVNDS